MRHEGQTVESVGSKDRELCLWIRNKGKISYGPGGARVDGSVRILDEGVEEFVEVTVPKSEDALKIGDLTHWRGKARCEGTGGYVHFYCCAGL